MRSAVTKVESDVFLPMVQAAAAMLLNCLAAGENGTFSPATMAKWSNGATWRRTVLGNQNRFYMRRTLFNIMTNIN